MLERAGLVILNQHVDVLGRELLGTEVAGELLQEGYGKGTVSTEEDWALSRRSAVHWKVSKDAPVPQMVKMLQMEPQCFRGRDRGRGASSTPTVETPATGTPKSRGQAYVCSGPPQWTT